MYAVFREISRVLVLPRSSDFGLGVVEDVSPHGGVALLRRVGPMDSCGLILPLPWYPPPSTTKPIRVEGRLPGSTCLPFLHFSLALLVAKDCKDGKDD